MNERALRKLVNRHGGLVKRVVMTNRSQDGVGPGIKSEAWFTADGCWWVPRALVVKLRPELTIVPQDPVDKFA